MSTDDVAPGLARSLLGVTVGETARKGLGLSERNSSEEQSY